MEERNIINLENFTGLNTRDSELDLPVGASPSLNNIEFLKRGWTIRPGFSKVNSSNLGAVVHSMFDGFNNFLIAYGGKVSKLVGSTVTELKTGLTSDFNSFASYNGLDMLACGSAYDNIQSWDGTTWADLAGSPPKADDICVWRNYVWLTGLASPNQGEVRFSELETPTLWPSGHWLRPTKREKGTTLICSRVVPVPQEPDGTRLAVFAADNIYHFTGFTKSLFQIFHVQTGIGSASKRAHVNADGLHYWIDDGGIYCSPDGGIHFNNIAWNIQPTFDAFNKTHLYACTAVHDRVKQQVWFLFSSGGVRLDTALVYNYGLSTPMIPAAAEGARHVWAKYSVNFISMAEIYNSSTSQYQLYAGESNSSVGGYVYQIGGSAIDDGTAIPYSYHTPNILLTRSFSQRHILRKINFVYDPLLPDDDQTLTQTLYLDGNNTTSVQEQTLRLSTDLADRGAVAGPTWWNRVARSTKVVFSGSYSNSVNANVPRCHRIEFEIKPGGTT